MIKKLKEKLFDRFTVKCRHIVMNKEDVMNTLEFINSIGLYDVGIGNCGWDDERKWFIHFDASNAKWTAVRDGLNVNRIWNWNDIPEKAIGKIYSTD